MRDLRATAPSIKPCSSGSGSVSSRAQAHGHTLTQCACVGTRVDAPHPGGSRLCKASPRPVEAGGQRRVTGGDASGRERVRRAVGSGPREGLVGGALALSQSAATVHTWHGPGLRAVSPPKVTQGKSLEDTQARAPRGAQQRREDLCQPVRALSLRGRLASVARDRAGSRQRRPAPLQPWPWTPGLLPACFPCSVVSKERAQQAQLRPSQPLPWALGHLALGHLALGPHKLATPFWVTRSRVKSGDKSHAWQGAGWGGPSSRGHCLPHTDRNLEPALPEPHSRAQGPGPAPTPPAPPRERRGAEALLARCFLGNSGTKDDAAGPPLRRLGSEAALSVAPGPKRAAMVEEVWVGSWRPHRPRGPIMALYSSPGPKYLIPPTTGFMKHTPTKLRAPAYSFRGAPMLLAENCSPGPRYSVNPKILRTGKDYGPAFSILGRYRTKTMLTPGPGDYFPERSTKHVFDSAPSHSISARTRTFRVDSTPGPAAYMLPAVMGPHSVGKASQPSFSIKGRSKLGSFSDDLHKTPGPAAYHQTDMQVTKLKAPQYTIAARVEPPGDKTLKPGPGAHSPEKVTMTKPCAPIITFGIKHSDYMTPLVVQMD